MQRRQLLRGFVGLTGLTGLAGCGSLGDVSGPQTTPTVEPSPAPSTATGGADAATPYRGASPDENLYRARGITVVNERSEPQYVTVAVDAVDADDADDDSDADDGREVAVRSATVPAGGRVTHYGLVAKRGVYRVTVDTAAGASVVREFVVSEGVSDLTVVVAERVRTRQEARCWPDCPPLSEGGFVGLFPRAETTVRWRGLGQVLVRNDGRRPRRVQVRLWAADEGATRERLLDYRYRVPAGMRLVLPLVARGGRYELAVAARTEQGEPTETRRVWHVPEESVAEFTVGGTVDAVCDLVRSRAAGPYGPFRLGGIRNDDEVAHTVTVVVDHAGGRFTERYEVPAGGRTDVGFQTDATDEVRLVARTDAGTELVGTWTHCPPAGSLVLTLDRRGRLRGYSDRQGLVAE